MKWPVVWVTLVQWTTIASACGISVHNEITHRAHELFANALANNVTAKYASYMVNSPSYVQAGSFFPDWGYQCLGFGQFSEDAHWPPFVRAALAYIHKEYPEPWGDQEEEVTGLVAFLFAIISHDVADVFWHGLGGFQESFIHAMAAQNFRGNIQKAHMAADTGADFTLRHASELKYFNVTWAVPVRDLANIYRQMYNHTDIPTPSEEDLRYCMRVGYTAFKAELQLGKYFFPYYGQQSPFLIENLNVYHRGGMQDMTARVVTCWEEIARYFGTGKFSGTMCSPHWDRSTRTTFELHSMPSRTTFNDQRAVLRESGYRVSELWDDSTGVTVLSLSAFTEEKYGFQHVFKQNEIPLAHNDFSDKCEEYTPDMTLTLNQTSGSLAYDVVLGDFNHDGYPDVAVSDPYHSARKLHAGVVMIVDGHKENHNINNRNVFVASSLQLYNNVSESRFGWSMVVLDFNCDGIDDLALSSPFGEPGDGFVSVYYGHAGVGLSVVPDVQIHIPQRKSNYGFGSRIFVLDVNGDGQKDLVIGCPHCGVPQSVQIGALYVFYSAKSHPKSISTPGMTFTSPIIQRYEHFGYSASLISNGKSRLLLIGALGYSLSDAQRVGRVYAFNVNNLKRPAVQWTMTGASEFQQFGSELDTFGNALVVSSRSEMSSTMGRNKKWQTGSVRIYNVDALMNRYGHIDHNTELTMSAFGKEMAAHFGNSLALENNVLWVGEPLAAQEQGRIYKWDMNTDEKICMSANEPRARFGHRIAVNNLPSRGKIRQVISSEYYSTESRLAGAIHIQWES